MHMTQRPPDASPTRSSLTQPFWDEHGEAVTTLLCSLSVLGGVLAPRQELRAAVHPAELAARGAAPGGLAARPGDRAQVTTQKRLQIEEAQERQGALIEKAVVATIWICCDRTGFIPDARAYPATLGRALRQRVPYIFAVRIGPEFDEQTLQADGSGA